MYNTTPLNFAINQENNEEVIKYLLANGANPRLALVDIIEAGNNNALNLLMKVAPSITVDEVFPQVMAMGMRLTKFAFRLSKFCKSRDNVRERK
ncbi:ankyrin repeat domain-containing protein [Rickettsia felis]|uniref:ankyrin repeat domain-containing protein n=1 Tax=Rickettsia felis TaxID=42862 RepID=UPI000AC852A4|nr:ankyrin repeat domain-containing protein [Rickettsia felis]